MNVDDVGFCASQRARKSHCTADVRASALPPSCRNCHTHLAEAVADYSIIPEEQHGKPITTGIQRLCEVDRRACDAERVRIAGTENVNYVRDLQMRIALRTR
jgi:hypothetical protein